MYRYVFYIFFLIGCSGENIPSILSNDTITLVETNEILIGNGRLISNDEDNDNTFTSSSEIGKKPRILGSTQSIQRGQNNSTLGASDPRRQGSGAVAQDRANQQ